ncbi:hypothetical protein HJFPF1_11649 [Paramyrothecium foliicola]|nr:hypothetical protein HJFPF1_11649 [Paramyrothecium foliicola]
MIWPQHQSPENASDGRALVTRRLSFDSDDTESTASIASSLASYEAFEDAFETSLPPLPSAEPAFLDSPSVIHPTQSPSSLRTDSRYPLLPSTPSPISSPYIPSAQPYTQPSPPSPPSFPESTPDYSPVNSPIPRASFSADSPSSAQPSGRHRYHNSNADQEPQLLDAVIEGIARINVAMDLDNAGRWRIKRLPQDSP